MTPWYWSKEAMLERGISVTRCFCALNDIPVPEITVITGNEECAYYRPHEGIVINVTKCAFVGSEGRQWSFPGYMVDRTPYGVLQHELGHHTCAPGCRRNRSHPTVLMMVNGSLRCSDCS